MTGPMSASILARSADAVGVSSLTASPRSFSQQLTAAIARTRSRADLRAYPDPARRARNAASYLASGPVTTTTASPSLFMTFCF